MTNPGHPEPGVLFLTFAPVADEAAAGPNKESDAAGGAMCPNPARPGEACPVHEVADPNCGETEYCPPAPNWARTARSRWQS